MCLVLHVKTLYQVLWEYGLVDLLSILFLYLAPGEVNIKELLLFQWSQYGLAETGFYGTFHQLRYCWRGRHSCQRRGKPWAGLTLLCWSNNLGLWCGQNAHMGRISCSWFPVISGLCWSWKTGDKGYKVVNKYVSWGDRTCSSLSQGHPSDGKW